MARRTRRCSARAGGTARCIARYRGRDDGITAACSDEDYATAMAAMAKLRAPLDAFFDKVTVNATGARIAPQSFASSS